MLLVVPLEGNRAVCTFLVVIVVALVFVEHKTAVSTRIDAQFEVVPRLLTHILHLRTQGQNATGTHEHRHAVERRLKGDIPSALVCLVGPEIIPRSTLRQVLHGSLRGREVDGSDGRTVGHGLTVPPCHGIRADDLFLRILRVDDGCGKDATTEHKLVGHVPHLLVAGEVAEQRTHVAVVVARHLPGRAI